MTTLTISGHSDDIIFVDGDIREEFNPDDGELLAFSDGTILRIRFEKNGVWRISRVATGSAAVTHVQAIEGDPGCYTDTVTLDGDIRWVVSGAQWAAKR